MAMSVQPPNSIEREMALALQAQEPVKGLPGVSIGEVKTKADPPFDISFELRSGKNRIRVVCEAKQSFSPRTIAEIAPWMRRLKALRPDLAMALVDTFLFSNNVSLLDLARGESTKPTLRFILPYDVGVFMYAREAQEIPIVSDTQAYLDLYVPSCGTRDRAANPLIGGAAADISVHGLVDLFAARMGSFRQKGRSPHDLS
jgi:hypothetical protein